MDEIMKEYKTCPEPKCRHPWVSSHFQDGEPCPCTSCGCHWSLTIKILHGLCDDMVDHKGKLPEIKPVPMPASARIEGKARKPFNAARFWIWFIVGILVLFMSVKLARRGEERLPTEQTIEERDTMELLGELIRLIEEGRCDEIPELIP